LWVLGLFSVLMLQNPVEGSSTNLLFCSYYYLFVYANIDESFQIKKSPGKKFT